MKGVKGTSFGVRFYRRAEKKQIKDPLSLIANESDADKTIETALRAFSQSLVLPQGSPSGLSVTAPGKEGTRSLHRVLWHAAQVGDCGAIRRSVMDGADLDARDDQGRTALHIATQYSQAEAVKTLLAAKEMRRMAKLGQLPDTAFFRKFGGQTTQR